MPKYRLLTKAELVEFEKEFIDYLILNGIDAPAWQKLKAEDKEKAESIVELFSDVIMEKILRKTKYLYRLENHAAFVFRFLDDKAQLYIMEFLGSTMLEANEKALVRYHKKEKGPTRIHFQEKDYETTREKAVFVMMEAGAWVSDGTLFEYLLSTQSN